MPSFPEYSVRVRPTTAPSPLVCDLTGETIPVAIVTVYRGVEYTVAPWVYEQLLAYGFGPQPEE